MQGCFRITGFAWPMSLLFSCAAFASEPTPPTLDIGPVKLGDSLATVKHTLGPPLRSEQSEGFTHQLLHYPGLDVSFDDTGVVVGIRATARSYCLENWLCPQMRYAEAVRLAAQHDNAKVIYGSIIVYGDGCWIEASQKRASVAAVEMKCQP